MGESELLFNDNHACPICGFSIDELEPRLFSFNSPFGACPTCDGLGTKLEVDLDLVVPDKNLSLNENAIEAWKPISSQYRSEEHTSELQSRGHLVCRLLLEKKKKKQIIKIIK